MLGRCYPRRRRRGGKDWWTRDMSNSSWRCSLQPPVRLPCSRTQADTEASTRPPGASPRSSQPHLSCRFTSSGTGSAAEDPPRLPYRPRRRSLSRSSAQAATSKGTVAAAQEQPPPRPPPDNGSAAVPVPPPADEPVNSSLHGRRICLVGWHSRATIGATARTRRVRRATRRRSASPGGFGSFRRWQDAVGGGAGSVG